MNDVLLFQKLQCCKNLYGKSSYQLWTKSIIIVPDDEFVQVFAQNFKDYTNMFSEDDKILDLDNVRGVVGIFFLQMSQQLNLDKCLLVEFGFIAYNFERQMLLFLMIINFEYLTITTLTHFL